MEILDYLDLMLILYFFGLIKNKINNLLINLIVIFLWIMDLVYLDGKNVELLVIDLTLNQEYIKQENLKFQNLKNNI